MEIFNLDTVTRFCDFSYEINEALHMSDSEKDVINNCAALIRAELDNRIDRHTKHIVTSYIETLLNHCSRFYERQFITREVSNRGLMSRLDDVLDAYFDSRRQIEEEGRLRQGRGALLSRFHRGLRDGPQRQIVLFFCYMVIQHGRLPHEEGAPAF